MSDFEPSHQQENVDLSVIIVTYNVAQLVTRCLETVQRECRGLVTEILVVDSASTDRTPEVLRERFPLVRVYASPVNLGFSAGNNVALRQCRGRYVLLLNPDTIVRPGALRALMGYLDQHRAVGAVGPALELPDGSIQPECARYLPKASNMPQWLLTLDKAQWALRYRRGLRTSPSCPPAKALDGFNLLFWSRDVSGPVECLCGACMLVRRQVVRDVGLLDESTPMYLDDIDYCRRIAAAGWPLHYVATATVVHLWEQSTAQSNRAGDYFALQCHAIWLYLRKHDGAAAAAMFASVVALSALGRLVIGMTAVAMTHGRQREQWRRRLAMGRSSGHWALRHPKRPPRLGFGAAPRNRALEPASHE